MQEGKLRNRTEVNEAAKRKYKRLDRSLNRSIVLYLGPVPNEARLQSRGLGFITMDDYLWMVMMAGVCIFSQSESKVRLYGKMLMTANDNSRKTS